MTRFLPVATTAAHEAGALLRRNLGSQMTVNSAHQHDIKLELDERSQELITKILLDSFPDHAILGEEGSGGVQGSDYEWVVDPIDGTVNYFYGIPHFCISIALRHHGNTILGLVYDPMQDDLWSVENDETTLLNGEPVHVSRHTELSKSMVCCGFGKSTDHLSAGIPELEKIMRTSLKCRIMGSSALELAYISCGRIDVFIQYGLSLWDIAAGVALIEGAGGKVEITPTPGHPGKLNVRAWNGITDLCLK